MVLPLTPHEQQVLSPWYFWLSLACPNPANQKSLSQLCFFSLQAAQESGLNWGPPCIVIPLILSLNPDPCAANQLVTLLTHQQLSMDLRANLSRLVHSWEYLPNLNEAWPLAKRKLLVIDKSLTPQLIGFCLAELIKCHLQYLDNKSREALMSPLLDLTSLRLFVDQAQILSPAENISASYIPFYQHDELSDLAVFNQLLDHISTNESVNHHIPKAFQAELLGLLQHFEALYQPSRRLLYTKLTRAYEYLGAFNFQSFQDIQLRRKRQSQHISQQVNQNGVIKALGRSGRLEHIAYSEWAYLNENLVPNLNYFYLKWAENDLIYLERDQHRLQTPKYLITHQFTESLHLNPISFTDEQFTLSILSWAHLVSLLVSQALQTHLGRASFSSQWLWSTHNEHQNAVKDNRATYQAFEAEREVFYLLNPLITQFEKDSQQILRQKTIDQDEYLLSAMRRNASTVHKLKVSYSSQKRSRLSAYELNIHFDQKAQWQIHLRPEYISKLKLNTHWLSSANFFQDNEALSTEGYVNKHSFSYLGQSLFYILSLMIHDIDR